MLNRKFTKSVVWFLALLGLFAVVIPVVLAANSYGPDIRFNKFYSLSFLETDIRIVTCWMTRIGFILIVIYVLLAGIRMATAGANATKFSEAGKAFKNVLIGGLVILGAGVIIATIANLLGVRIIWPGIC